MNSDSSTFLGDKKVGMIVAIDASFSMNHGEHSRFERAVEKAKEIFEAAIATAPQVRECHNVTGTFEYLLRIEVPDLAAYKSFHTDMLGTLADVSALTSYIVLESPKDERA